MNGIEIDRGAIEKAVRAYMQESGQQYSREEKTCCQIAGNDYRVISWKSIHKSS